MSLFDKISKRLFSADKKVGVHEILVRTNTFKDDYNIWLDGPQFSPLKHDILKSWGYTLNNIKSPVDMSVFTSDYANGFTIHPEYQDAIIPLSYLMEFFKDQMLTMSYRLVHTERIMDEKKGYVETLEKYYLKPPRSSESPKDQMFGNVIIELLKHDRNEMWLKFLVTIYSDRQYTEPEDFNDLMSFLFDK